MTRSMQGTVPIARRGGDSHRGKCTSHTLMSREEALAVADVLDDWPPGLGFVLMRSSRPRGWQIFKWSEDPRSHWRLWDEPPPLGPDVKHCPVVTLHVMRGVSESGSARFREHHDAFWGMIDTLAPELGLDRETTREWYNDYLREDPRGLAEEFRALARRLVFTESHKTLDNDGSGAYDLLESNPPTRKEPHE